MSFLAYQPIVDKLKYDDLRMLITYLASIPRYVYVYVYATARAWQKVVTGIYITLYHDAPPQSAQI